MRDTELYGRREIFTSESVITAGNVVDVLMKAMITHARNQNEIQYLYDYYRGKTPILNKRKEIRAEINHKINVNRANEIVNFFLGYGFGEPIKYIRRGSDESLTDGINELNDLMQNVNKVASDKRLAEWMLVCGVGMRMIAPGTDEKISVYTLDPRYSFVVKHSGLGEPVVMGVKFVESDSGMPLFSVFTQDMYYEIEGTTIKKKESHISRGVPIFEYPANQARLGAFEIVLPLLDAISELESNRMDDVVQYVNSFLALLGGSIDADTHAKLQEFKMLCLPEGVDAKYLSSAMQQADAQVQADSLYQTVLTIVGMPNRNGGSSTSDTGQAVELRDGWASAESRMKGIEEEFKGAEADFLRMVLWLTDSPLTFRDIEIKFTRRNYEGMLAKSQILTTLLNSQKVAPRLAFVYSGISIDPESDYLESKAYWEGQEAKLAEGGAASA